MTTFSTDLLRIARKAKGLDTATNAFLTTCKELAVTTVEHFDRLVAQAYTDNGWSQRAGRPARGSKLKPAPEGVKVCVYAFRRALALGLAFADYKTVYALREAIKAAATPEAVPHDEPRPALVGVVVRKPHELTGVLWHDSIVLASELPDDVRDEYEAAVRKVMERFLGKAPALAA